MKRFTVLTILLLVLAVPALATETVMMETSHGKITIELDDVKAPLSVANFLSYVDAGHYEGTIFHRVIKDFMIQGGNFSAEMTPKQTKAPIKNEAYNGLKNRRGTIAMARTNVVDSATSQFFINLKDNGFLDHRGSSPREFGYAVFGRVVEGMDVVDKIGASQTQTFKRFRDVPAETVTIVKVTRVKAE